jgi:hypothetical protein
MFRKFASIAHSDKYGYTFDTDKWEYRSNPFLSQKFRMFETYGDRMTQHSHDWPVSEEFAIDYLFSLAAAMLDDEELAEKASHSFSGGVHKDTLKFAASLVFNPDKDKEWGKTRYFSMSLGKVTRDREKQHDDRYKQLNEYQDGTPKSILALVTDQHCDGLEMWFIADAVRNWCADNLKNGWMEMPAVQLKWFEGKQSDQYAMARLFRDAVEACQNAGEWLRMKRNATAGVENYRNALERKREREAQAEAHGEIATTESSAA